METLITALQPKKLNAKLLTEEQTEFRAFLDAHVSGQDDAKDEFVELLGEIRNPLRDTAVPMSRLLVGPSTSGKTLLFKLLVEWVNGDASRMLFFQGSEYMERHQLNRLIGAPPGYLGHRPEHERKGALRPGQKDTASELSQHNLDNSLINSKKGSVLFLLFDEFEKFHWDFSMFMLGVLREGKATIGDLTTSVFANAVIGFTSNLAAAELDKMKTPMGFTQRERKVIGINDVRQTVVRELKRGYAPEFRNRIGKVVFFKGLSDDEMLGVVSMEVAKVQERVFRLGKRSFVLTVDNNAKYFLLKDPSGGDEDREKGPIPLMQERMKSLLENKLGAFCQMGMFHEGDMVTITHKEGEGDLTFEIIEDPLSKYAPAAAPVTESATESTVEASHTQGAAPAEGETDKKSEVTTAPAAETPQEGAPDAYPVAQMMVMQDFVVHLHCRSYEDFSRLRHALAAALTSNPELIRVKKEQADYEELTLHVSVMAPIELMYAVYRTVPGIKVEILPGFLE